MPSPFLDVKSFETQEISAEAEARETFEAPASHFLSVYGYEEGEPVSDPVTEEHAEFLSELYDEEMNEALAGLVAEAPNLADSRGLEEDETGYDIEPLLRQHFAPLAHEAEAFISHLASALANRVPTGLSKGEIHHMEQDDETQAGSAVTTTIKGCPRTVRRSTDLAKCELDDWPLLQGDTFEAFEAAAAFNSHHNPTSPMTFLPGTINKPSRSSALLDDTCPPLFRPSPVMPVCRTLICGLILLVCPKLFSAAELPDPEDYFVGAPIFEIGQIPFQTVWEGSDIKFRVRATAIGNDTPVTAGFAQPPSEMVYFDSAGRFYYRPGPDDKAEFTVTFTATSGEQRLQQMVPIQPIRRLPPETDILGVEPGPLPDPTSRDYLVITDVKELAPTLFNHAQRQLRSVTISGVHVVLASGHANHLHTRYNGNEDIRRLEIFAETLTISDTLWLPSTAVTIHARRVDFDDRSQEPAQISTEPPPFPTDALGYNSETGELPKDGLSGLKGGDITVHAVYLNDPSISSRERTRFVLNGSRGQNAGIGRAGINGRSVESIRASELNSLWSDQKISQVTALIVYPFGYDSAMRDVYFGPWQRRLQNRVDYIARGYLDQNDAWKPTSGEPAIGDGRPGDGGPAGRFATSVPRELWPNQTKEPYSSAVGGYPAVATNRLGGMAGTPRIAEAYERVPVPFLGTLWLRLRSTDTTHGSSAMAKVGSIGESSYPRFLDDRWSWLASKWLRQVVNHAKDSYLNGQTAFVHAVMNDYIFLLEDYRQSPEWDNVSANEQRDLVFLDEEMRLMAHRVASNLDYFGNPPGWVPLLSLEATYAAIRNEINRAINMLYLEYWLTSVSASLEGTIGALAYARTQLAEESRLFSEQYAVASRLVPELDLRIAKLDSDVRFLQFQLEALEAELLRRAEAKTKGPMWKRVAKGLATIAKMVPWPQAQAVGAGLDIVSNLNPDSPWDSLADVQDVIAAYKGGDFGEQAKALNDTYRSISVQPLPTNPDAIKGYIDDLQKKTAPVVQSLTDVQRAFLGTGAPRSQIEAELARLKAESPEFQELVSKIATLMSEKQVFMEQLGQTIQMLGTLSKSITANLLMMDALNEQYAAAIGALDDRAVMYVREMGRTARERLLRYHYYLKKAYEHRLLRPYTANLNLDSLFERFKQLGEAGTGHLLTPEQFNMLRGVYEDRLALIGQQVLSQYVADGAPQEKRIRFALSTDEVFHLNSGKPVNVNLGAIGIAGLFPSGEEDLRIVGVRAHTIALRPKPGVLPTPTDHIEIKLVHQGTADIHTSRNADPRQYRFRYYTHGTEVPVRWSTRYWPLTDEMHHVQGSAAADSLLRALLPGTLDVDFFTHLGALADLEVSVGPGSKFLLDEVVLEVSYSMIERAHNLHRLELSISDGLAPYIQIDTEDLNGRQDALGSVARFYRQGQRVVVRVPERIGNMRFSGFFGVAEPHAVRPASDDVGPFVQRAQQSRRMDVPTSVDDSSIVLDLIVDADISVEVQYRVMDVLELAIDRDSDSGSRILTIDGHRLTAYVLEESPHVTGPWSRVLNGLISKAESIALGSPQSHDKRFYRLRSDD